MSHTNKRTQSNLWWPTLQLLLQLVDRLLFLYLTFNTFFLYILFSRKYLIIFIYLSISTQPAANSLCYLWVVFWIYFVTKMLKYSQVVSCCWSWYNLTPDSQVSTVKMITWFEERTKIKNVLVESRNMHLGTWEEKESSQ